MLSTEVIKDEYFWLNQINSGIDIGYVLIEYILGKWNIFLRLPKFQSCAGYS